MVLQEIQHCPCGKIHRSSVKELVVGAGVLETLPEIVLNPITDDTAEIVVEVFSGVSSVQIFRIKKSI